MILSCRTKPLVVTAIKSVIETLHSYLKTNGGEKITLRFSAEGIYIDESLKKTQISPLCGFRVFLPLASFDAYVLENISIDYETGIESKIDLSVQVELSKLVDSFKNFIKYDILEITISQEEHMSMKLDRISTKNSQLISSVRMDVQPVAPISVDYPVYTYAPAVVDIASFTSFCKARVTKRVNMAVRMERDASMLRIVQFEAIDNTVYLYNLKPSHCTPVSMIFHHSILVKPTKFTSHTSTIDIYLEEHKPLRYSIEVSDILTFDIYISPKN